MTPAAGGVTLVSVSSTSAIRSAQTAARGTCMSMNVPIMIDIRICIRYCRKAVSGPTCITPLSTRMPPNQITATLATLMTSIISGNIVDIHRPARRATSVSSSLACAKRSVS